MTNRIFLDSSILVERAKGTQIELYDFLAGHGGYEKCINQIILSEFAFYLLIIEGGKAPLTLKRDGAIPTIIRQHNPSQLLQMLTYLESGSDIIPVYLKYMDQYNLLPNDALILATC